jgi:DNA repair protein RadC
MKLKTKYKEKIKISGASCINELAQDYRKSKQECFVCFYLDSAHQVIAREVCTIGLLNSCQIDAREVFKRALFHNAKAIILSHNHPSGNLTFSSEDIKVTEQLTKGGEFLGIPVLDHVIVAPGGTFNSYK